MTALVADCANCAGLCCVALPFARSADFPVDKPAGQACLHLREDFRCAIHARLRDEGYRGCVSFDCFGAGQRVTAAFDQDWRDRQTAPRMFAAFAAVRQLHEMLLHLAQAAQRCDDDALRAELVAASARIEGHAAVAAAGGVKVDVASERAEVGALLSVASEALRRGAPVPDGRARRYADLAGADLRGAELRGADLRGAVLIAADLREADLCRTDLLGADLRDADMRGADLREALFVTAPQVSAARGDETTRLPDGLARPAHWAAAASGD